MKKLVPVFMVALAAVTIAAVYLWQELRDLRMQTSELKTHITEMQSAQLTAATAPAMPASTTTGPQPAAATAPPVAAPIAATAAPAEKKSNGGLEGLARQMLGTPEGQEMMKAQLRLILPQQYPDIDKELGLTPAETEKLFDLLAKQQMAMSTGGLDILAGNGAADRTALEETRRKIQDQQRATQAEVAAMLGDKLPKYQEYEKTLPMRQQVTQLKASLGTGNNALNDTQAKPLIAALAAEQTRIQQDRANAPRPQQQPQQGPPNAQAAMEQQMEQQLARAAEDNRRMVSAASSYLNPQQLDAYRQQLEQQQNLQRTLMRSIGSQLGNQGTGSSQPAPRTP